MDPVALQELRERRRVYSEAPSPAPVTPPIVYAEPFNCHENIQLKEKIKDLEKEFRILKLENDKLKEKMNLDKQKWNQCKTELEMRVNVLTKSTHPLPNYIEVNVGQRLRHYDPQWMKERTN